MIPTEDREQEALIELLDIKKIPAFAIPNGGRRNPGEKVKKILDVTCGSRSIWFDRHNDLAIFCDKRCGTYGLPERKSRPGQHAVQIEPDVVCDFTNLPFDDNAFKLVVFDPPHRIGQVDSSWISKRYGLYASKEEMIESVANGFKECYRVLEPDGILIFKWGECSVKVSDIMKEFGVKPLFGHVSGKKMGTHWLCFMKGATDAD